MELYRPLIQQNETPKDGYLCKSFSYIVVSKVLYFIKIKWEKLVDFKYRGKTKYKDIILYKKEVEN